MFQGDVTEIGKYKVFRELGRGATSRVFLAEDPFAKRLVAIKAFYPDTQNEVVLRRFEHLFLNEAALVGKLSHPHIVAIYDAASAGGYHYLVMEYVAGGTLEAASEPENLLPLHRVVEIVWKCSRALAFAHLQGIIHRDIKPGNILLGEDGDIKITDFGLALQERQERTAISGIGTPAYMSPEQIREYPLNHQTDIYSLGVVMYKLLTGHLPFSASASAALAEQILNGSPVPAIQRRPDLPPELNRIVMKAIQRDMNERYQRWTEFSNDLARFYRKLEVTEVTLSDTEKFDRIRALSFFQDFSDVQIWETVRIGLWHTVDPDTVIIKEGDVGDGFFVVSEGEVRVTRQGKLLNTLRPGDCFGEMLYFATTTSRRTSTITTQTRVVALEIKAKALHHASHACQVMFDKAFMRILIDRLTAANARLSAPSGER
ncbi:MAG TPA: protein kinase [Burkholderiales bacterium]|nr:protein kinase [Burkholderiales bacterium]